MSDNINIPAERQEVINAMYALRAKKEKMLSEQKASLVGITNRFNLHFVHIRQYNHKGEVDQNGGICVAFQLPERKKDKMFEVSVAYCHENDRYERFAGRRMAASHFAMGQRLTLRRRDDYSFSQFVRQTFGWCM